ncbi:MAG: TlpA disulfide reductase family protein [Alphaproteobacteria bacterium]
MTTIRIALTSAWILAALAGPAGAAPAAGEPAPALVIPEIDGAHFDLAALRGKVVIVNFWATWCPPCREEMPALDAFYARFRTRGVEVLGISVDRSRDRQSVIEAAQAVHYPAAILADAETNGFGKPAVLPVTYIVDPTGIVRALMTPDTTAVTEDALERAVTPLLPGDHPSP